MLKIHVVWKHNKISHVELALHGSFLSKDERIQRWLDSYLQKKDEPFPLELDISHLTPFTQKVLKAIQQIPFGQTRSYSEIAELIGHPKAVRACGSACGRNPYPLFIPCHRVVSSNGLGGFALDLRVKEKLLSFESAC